MGREFASVEDLTAAIGEHLGYSDWAVVDQARIDGFADATGDHQWIHVDPERAKDGPFGTTIAHGYLTLSISNMFLPELLHVTGARHGVNYGANKVRFPAPVPVNARIRMGCEILEVAAVGDGVQVVTRNTVEVDGSDKPACVVEAVSRYTF